MATFAHERMKFIFVHVPKTGGTSVSSFFFQGRREQWRDGFSLTNHRLAIHAGIADVAERLHGDIHDYYSFAFYRNTWDWLYSMYRYVKKSPGHPFNAEVRDIDFEEFVFKKARNIYRPQKNLVTIDGELAVSELLDFNNFEILFSSVLRQLGYENTEVEWKNKNAGTHSYREIYTDGMRDHVGELYAEDIEWFNFKF